MLKYLIKIPCEVLGHNMLNFLELIDIIQFENAAASQKSQQLLKAILPYCPPIPISDSFSEVKFKLEAFEWVKKRLCRFQFVKIDLDSLSEFNLEYSMMNNNIELCLKKYATLNLIETLQNSHINEKVFRVEIHVDQDPTVMDVLFSLLTSSSIRSLDIKLSNISQWMEHIKQIGPCLHVFTIHEVSTELSLLKTILEYCPYLEKLSFVAGVSNSSNILQNIANNCPNLYSLDIDLMYASSVLAEFDADLTTFAEKCPQLEELSLNCYQLTDQSVIALAQHCSRLKKLKLSGGAFTATSLIALSERGLPLEDLVFPWFPIPSSEIAVRCAYALSRIRELRTYNYHLALKNFFYEIKFMTGLRELYLDSLKDYLLVTHLLLLQEQCCAGLESLTIGWYSSISLDQLFELIKTRCGKLLTLQIVDESIFTSPAVLLQLARSCPHLQDVALYRCSKVTEEGLLALAVHCRQLRDLDLCKTILTEETIRQLAQHSRHLTRLCVTVNVREGEVSVEHKKDYSSKEIRALRELQVRHSDSESNHTEVITHVSNNNACCLIM